MFFLCQLPSTRRVGVVFIKHVLAKSSCYHSLAFDKDYIKERFLVLRA